MEITDLQGRRLSRVRSKDRNFASGGSGYFKAAVQGNLKQFAKDEERIAGQAVRASIKRATSYLRNEMNRQMKAAGIKTFKIGRREWWLAVLFDTKKNSGIGTTGKVYSGFGRAAWAFEHGAIIKGRSGNWMVIPAADIPNARQGIKSWASFGNLMAIPTRNPNVQRLMLRRKGQPDMLVAWLVKQVVIKKKINFNAAAKKWGDKIPEYIVTEWTRRATKKGLEL
jgi:hypothetical protein